MRTCASLFFAIACTSAFADIKVYTDRPQARFAKAAQLFQQQTGQNVVFVEGAYADLKDKIEKDVAPADVIITKDLVYLAELADKGMVQSMKDTRALKTVHEFMRDPNRRWVGLTFRARSVVYDPARLSAAELTTYEDLASQKWAGRLCLRTAKAAYNEALVGHLLEAFGESKVKTIVAGWVANLAVPVFPSDVPVINAVANGTCDVGIVNHYYLAMELARNPNLPVRMAFLDQSGPGVHTNGTGAAVISGSANAADAQTFIEILLTDEVQLEMSSAHYDFPAVIGLAPNTFIKDWGSFKMSPVNWTSVGLQAEKARSIMSGAGYQ